MGHLELGDGAEAGLGQLAPELLALRSHAEKQSVAGDGCRLRREAADCPRPRSHLGRRLAPDEEWGVADRNQVLDRRLGAGRRCVQDHERIGVAALLVRRPLPGGPATLGEDLECDRRLEPVADHLGRPIGLEPRKGPLREVDGAEVPGLGGHAESALREIDRETLSARDLGLTVGVGHDNVGQRHPVPGFRQCQGHRDPGRPLQHQVIRQHLVGVAKRRRTAGRRVCVRDRLDRDLRVFRQRTGRELDRQRPVGGGHRAALRRRDRRAGFLIAAARGEAEH